jgi:peptide deformylase
LSTTCVPIVAIDDGVRLLVDEMNSIVCSMHGAGIAAPQVGSSLRVIIVSYRKNIVMINPIIVGRSRARSVRSEGCLSLPGRLYDVERCEACTVKYVRLDGTPTTVVYDGVAARIVQHEVDHLDGLTIDVVGKFFGGCDETVAG